MGELEQMDVVKHKAVYWFFTHIFLRRIGKRYPDLFKQWVYDATDNPTQRRIMMLRYTGETRMKFPAIAITLGIDQSNMFKYHKSVVERIISG